MKRAQEEMVRTLKEAGAEVGPDGRLYIDGKPAAVQEHHTLMPDGGYAGIGGVVLDEEPKQ